jgi:hypothetical protein
MVSLIAALTVPGLVAGLAGWAWTHVRRDAS